jgi:hypothetical protein
MPVAVIFRNFQKWLTNIWQFDGSCACSTVRVENWCGCIQKKFKNMIVTMIHFWQVLSVQDAEEVQGRTSWYCILFVVIGVVTGLGMFLQVLNFECSVVVYLIIISPTLFVVLNWQFCYQFSMYSATLSHWIFVLGNNAFMNKIFDMIVQHDSQ